MKKLIDYITKFIKRKPQLVKLPAASPSFVEDFSSGKLDPAKWVVSTWTAPTASFTHYATFSASNVEIIDGVLRLSLYQDTTSHIVMSTGAEIATVQKFGYGTYEWVMRSSSTAASINDSGLPVNGSISGCFTYVDKSATELDIEVEGNSRCNLTQYTTWNYDTNPNESTSVRQKSGDLPHESFHTYTVVWTAGSVMYYRDGVLSATHTKSVPKDPAFAMINHWGTNTQNWGGLPTDGVRYMWVKRFSFTPLNE